MSPTWVEARSAKTERLRREQRFYTPDLLGRPCPECGIKVPKALDAAYHPTCGPDARYAMHVVTVSAATKRSAD